MWNAVTSQNVHTRTYQHADLANVDNSECQQSFVDAFYNKTQDTISLVTYDHNILMCNCEDLEIQKQVKSRVVF